VEPTPPAETAAGRTFRAHPPSDTVALGRGWSIWMWPALGIAAVAVVGQLFGVFGAIVAVGECVVVAFYLAGRLLDRSARVKAVSLAVVVAGTIVVVLLAVAYGPSARWHVPSAAKTPGPIDLRGKIVTAQTAGRISLRGGLLAGARMSGLDLRHNDLSGASAPGATFTMARLDGVSLRGADLRGADLSLACLRGADLTGALLRGADVAGADLGGATLPHGAAEVWVGTPAPPNEPPRHCR
jgi:hypothetical protein